MLCGGYALLIRKHGQWDIPKGKRKKKERAEKCARREVAEETGLKKRTAVHTGTAVPLQLHHLLREQAGEQDG